MGRTEQNRSGMRGGECRCTNYNVSKLQPRESSVSATTPPQSLRRTREPGNYVYKCVYLDVYRITTTRSNKCLNLLFLYIRLNSNDIKRSQ